jgi:mono/diheme cytochrome c family protein
MVIAFFILCAVVAVAVYLAAAGGSRRETLPGESRLANRTVLLVVVLTFAFGLVVPVLVLVKNGESQASTAVGVHLSSKEVKGRELFVDACAICHTLKATNSVGRIGPILDKVVPEVSGASFKARKALVLTTILEGRALGLGNMPKRLYEGPQAEAVAEFVAAVAGHK